MTQRPEVSKAVGKMVLIDSLHTGVITNLKFVKKNAVSAKHKKAKCSKMRYVSNRAEK